VKPRPPHPLVLELLDQMLWDEQDGLYLEPKTLEQFRRRFVRLAAHPDNGAVFFGAVLLRDHMATEGYERARTALASLVTSMLDVAPRRVSTQETEHRKAAARFLGLGG
jgi:hypothetical protein